MLFDKISSRDCESPLLKKCIGSQSLLGNNMSISSQYHEDPFKVEKIRSAHVPINRSPLNTSMNPFHNFVSSDSSLVNQISKSFPPPNSFFRNYCRGASELEIFREIAGYELSKSTQFIEKVAETICYITDSYMNKMVNTSENHSVCTKQSVDTADLSKRQFENKTSKKVDQTSDLTNSMCSVYSCDNQKSNPSDCAELSTKTGCSGSDLSSPNTKNLKTFTIDMIPKITVEIPVPRASAQKNRASVIICHATLNQELINRKNKDIQKRSRNRRRRQKKNKKANLEKECDMKNDAKSKQEEFSSQGSKMHNAVKNKNIKCDALHHVKDETDNTESVQIILPNVSSFFISVESTDGDSDWDESCDSEWLDDASEFECTGLNVINLTTPKVNTVLLTIPSSHKEDDKEALRLNAVLHRVNNEWNESTKELKGKLKCSTKVSFAPDDELVEVLPVEIYDRKGEWELYALERLRFKRRIDELEKIISPCLSKEHRAKVYKKMFEANL
ncbi:PP1c_bdg domain-containing protein [Trichonephila inaurata madagascariensis]|uniref:Protein DP71L n=1 Tax=Trichonephila inaurata madagascariensis TaxID=2747483 RepID=A0A8X6M9Y3_9ARAC|nr:PP1c_bdg domain-containing protein [Trichonephila inaurata madagascariensis]